MEGFDLRMDTLTQKDDGDYTCVVKNSVGSVNHTVRLQIQGRLVFPLVGFCGPDPVHDGRFADEFGIFFRFLFSVASGMSEFAGCLSLGPVTGELSLQAE